MISLEQVQLLEAKVSKAIEYLQRVNAENAALVSQKEELQKRLSNYEKRIDELEVLVMQFKEDQGRIEDGIIAALDRLSQFEEAFENSLKDKTPAKKTIVKAREAEPEPPQSEVYFEIKGEDTNSQNNNIENSKEEMKEEIIENVSSIEDKASSENEELDIF